MYETNYNGLRYCFYDDCLTVNDTTLRYELMENIRHRGGDSPAFVFEYSGRQLALPYPPDEIAQILPYMKLASQITPEPDPIETVPLEDVISEPVAADPGPVIADVLPDSAATSRSGSYNSSGSPVHAPKKNTKKGCLMLAAIIALLLIALFACFSGGDGTDDNLGDTASAPAADESTSTEEATEETTTAPTTEADPRDDLNTEERNAYSSALTYLSSMGFSRSGLIKQLEYEQYSSDACEKAVSLIEELGEVDWNEECLQTAKNYLSTMSFSKGELIDQLKFEGFTDDQINAVIDEAYQ